jgi:cytochrome oxidase assembly protein ShyY1
MEWRQYNGRRRAHVVIGLRRPPWWAMVLTAAGMLLFMRLGIWQLHRASYKEELLQHYAQAASEPVRDFRSVANAGPGAGFPRVEVSGRYLVDRLYLLDNPNHDRRGGVEVFAPFVVDGESRLLLVDQGFLAADSSGHTLQPPPLPPGEVRLQGIYVPPPPVGFEMGGNALARQQQWPKNSIYLDLTQVAQDLGHAVYPRVLALDADPASIYVRVHQLDFSSMPPARHRAYAFQWFAFAIAALVILLVVNRDKSRH